MPPVLHIYPGFLSKTIWRGAVLILHSVLLPKRRPLAPHWDDQQQKGGKCSTACWPFSRIAQGLGSHVALAVFLEFFGIFGGFERSYGFSRQSWKTRCLSRNSFIVLNVLFLARFRWRILSNYLRGSGAAFSENCGFLDFLTILYVLLVFGFFVFFI